MTDDDILTELDRRSERSMDGVRALLLEMGRTDLLIELGDKLRAIRSGVDSARSTWAALSKPQRRALELIEAFHLRKARGTRAMFDFFGKSGLLFDEFGRVRSATVNHLMHRELIAWAPDKKVVITERGRFVLKHGPAA